MFSKLSHIDTYDMPKEFNRLQAQNLNSPRAFQDLITNIGKYIPKNKAKQIDTSNTLRSAAPASSTVDSLMKRAFIFIEDGEWSNAHKQFEKILDTDKVSGTIDMYDQDYKFEAIFLFTPNGNGTHSVKLTKGNFGNKDFVQEDMESILITMFDAYDKNYTTFEEYIVSMSN